jgi:tape measure domain-containing protein
MAELKLRVSLDTSYLKGQISRLPLEFAGANVSIRPKFDKRTIVSELGALNRYISSKKFNIAINTNLEAEIKNADRLVKALGRVQQAASGARGGLPIGTQRLSRTKGEGGFAAAEIKALFGAAVQGGLIDEKTLATTRAQMVTALGGIGRDSITGLLNGLKSGDADIQKAAQMLGNNLINSFKTVLGIASPSKEFKKLGESAGQGFEQGLLKSIEIAEQSATRKMQRMLDRLARMALMMSGMSGPEIGRQIAQSRALPSLNFGATTPRTSVSIGPSSTGRALPPAASRVGLPGTSFASQKLLSGDLLTPSMKNAIRDVANDFVDGIRQRMNEAIRQIKVEDLGRVSQRILPGSRVAGYLPPVARFGEGRTPSPYSTGRLGREGETRSELFARREREARMRSALRGVDVMGAGPSRTPAPYSQFYRASPSSVSAIVPYAAGGAIVPSSRGGGGAPPVPPRGVGGGGGSFGGMQFNVPQLPGAGLVREIGTEFGFAAKQVLLFGTAYKALAFIQGFPAQVGSAVGALQSFRNTLSAISPSAEEAAASSQFILDVVDKYNTPIQSARDGFTKLYASMKPTGFSGNEIRDLFLGISQAAATFGMSAEKVDRVNYAFAQMASKGQVMSEELKGQLGDVLPGAMGIFAEAAGFTGPDAITKFSKALEDGAYKGAAMKTLLTNVGVIMRKEFGPGAEGAARTFQGVINRMQNSFKLLYESFEPVAVGFLNSVVMPLTSGIKTVTDGFNAFFTGQAAQTAGGSVFAKQLELLRPTFEGIAANIKQVLPLLQSFANTALSLGQVLLQIAGNPFAGYLARIYLSVLPLTVALRVLNLQVLIPLIGSFLRAIPAFISFNAAMISGTSANKGLQLAMQLTGQTAGVTAGKIRLVGAALATLGTTAILAGIGLLIERFLMMKSAIDGVRQSTQQMLGSISGMANTGAVKELQNVSRNIQKQKDTFAELKKFVYGGRLGGGSKALTPEMAAKFEEVGMGSFVSKNLFGKPMIADFLRATEIIDARLQSLNKESSSVAEKLPLAVKVAADIAKQAKTAETIAPIPPAGTEGGGDGGKDKGADDAKRLREEIARQAAAASDALFAEQQRLLILQQTNPIAEAIAKYASEEASIQRELNAGLKEAKSEKEKIDLKEAARLQGAANRLELEQSINDEAEKALKPITDLLASQREELALTTETEKLMKEGISPERAKQIAQVRLLVKQQLEALDLSIDQADAAITEAKARGASVKAVEDLIAALDRLKEKRREGEEQGKAGEEGVPKDKPKDYLGDALTSAEARLKELLNPAYQLAEAAKTIGDSFGEAFKGIITGSMTVQEAFAGLFQSIADRFADMVAEMIARWLEAQLIKGFLSLFPGAAPAAEASQAVLRFADGGVASGGFQAFANGGIVTGPTLGLVGEGRYNEAVIPLPDGKSVPVDLGGMTGGMGGEVTSNIVVNINNGQMQGNGNSNGSELGRKIEGAVKQVLVSELRPGGILSSGRR